MQLCNGRGAWRDALDIEKIVIDPVRTANDLAGVEPVHSPKDSPHRHALPYIALPAGRRPQPAARIIGSTRSNRDDIERKLILGERRDCDRYSKSEQKEIAHLWLTSVCECYKSRFDYVD